MSERGRISAAALSVISASPQTVKIEPPENLAPTEAKRFRDLVAAAPHLVPADALLISAYIQASLAADRACRRLPRSARALSQWEVAVRLMAMLAVKLRLTPRGRTDPKVVARAARKHSVSAYDRMRFDD